MKRLLCVAPPKRPSHHWEWLAAVLSLPAAKRRARWRTSPVRPKRIEARWHIPWNGIRSNKLRLLHRSRHNIRECWPERPYRHNRLASQSPPLDNQSGQAYKRLHRPAVRSAAVPFPTYAPGACSIKRHEQCGSRFIPKAHACIPKGMTHM